jgi:copper chaperone CopZ
MNYNAADVTPENIKVIIGNVAERFKPADYDANEVIKRTVSFWPAQMNCGNCLAGIKKSLKSEAGVLDIDGDVETKPVTVTYDANKVCAKTIRDGFG